MTTHIQRGPDRRAKDVCPQCKVGTLQNSGTTHVDTDQCLTETWTCTSCDYTEGRNPMNMLPGNRETLL